MAGPYYLRSTDGSDASDGLTWANAKATLAGAFAVMAAGERVWVSQVHAETQTSAMLLTSPGTAALPCEVLCGDDSAEPPTALATTASISVTTNTVTMGWAGFAHYYGIIFNVGSGSISSGATFATSPTTPFWHKFEACSLRILSTGTATRVQFGTASTSTDDALVEFENTTFQFSHVGQAISGAMRFIWTNTNASTAILGTTPTTLFVPQGGNADEKQIIGVDLSALGSGTNLVNVASASPASLLFLDCKLGSSVSITTGSVPGQGGTRVNVINCDSGPTNYRYYFQSYQGTITQETTIIRTGGASDGTTAVSRKMVTTANSRFVSPLKDNWSIPYWNETLSAITVTIPVLTDNITLTDAEAWIEVEYAGTSGFPLGVFVSDRAATIIATPANQATDGVSSWASAPGTPVKQSLAVTFTPAEKGILRARVVLARASTTIYYDPLLQVT